MVDCLFALDFVMYKTEAGDSHLSCMCNVFLLERMDLRKK